MTSESGIHTLNGISCVRIENFCQEWMIRQIKKDLQIKN